MKSLLSFNVMVPSKSVKKMNLGSLKGNLSALRSIVAMVTDLRKLKCMMYVFFCCKDICLYSQEKCKEDVSVTVYTTELPHATWDQKVVNARPSDMRLCSLTSVSSLNGPPIMQGQEHSILACVPGLRKSLVLRLELELPLAVGLSLLLS